MPLQVAFPVPPLAAIANPCPHDMVDNAVAENRAAVLALITNVTALEARLAAVESRPAAGAPVTVTLTAAQETQLAAVTPGTLVRLQGPTASFYAVAQ